MQLKPVRDQTVVVMGASSGIGRETALHFARKGARVVAAARGGDGLNSLVEEIRGEGGAATAIRADATDFDQVKAVADGAVQEYGGLDTWVHLSAVGLYATFDEISPEEFGRVVDVDLMGQVYGAMAALPHLKREGRGALVHVSSILARRSVPLQSPYCAAKHGVDGFLESLRVELLHEGWGTIGVTNVMPASINTPLFDKARTKLGYKPLGLPPLYPPSTVTRAILYAAERAPRDLVVGGAGKVMLWTQRLSPRLMDAFLLRTGFRWQQTDQPRPEDAPDGLFGPVEGHNKVEGEFGRWALGSSVSTWLDTHPAAKAGAVAGGALAALAVLRARS